MLVPVVLRPSLPVQPRKQLVVVVLGHAAFRFRLRLQVALEDESFGQGPQPFARVSRVYASSETNVASAEQQAATAR